MNGSRQHSEECLLTDSLPHQCQAVLSARGSLGRRTRGLVGTTGLLGAPHTHTHGITRQQHRYSTHARGPPPAAGARRQWGAVSSLVAQTQLGAFLLGSWGRGCGVGPRPGTGSEQAGEGEAGRGAVRPHSSDCSISSCFSTFVWLVSRISPARNISSTTV